MNANSNQPFRAKVVFRVCPICNTLSELVDVVKRIYICPIHGQWGNEVESTEL